MGLIFREILCSVTLESGHGCIYIAMVILWHMVLFYGIICHFYVVWSNTGMKERFIGEIIKERRKELHLTQARLCEGICEPTTISRLENNEQTPSRNTVRALLQRLGLPDDRWYFAAVTGKELELDRLHNEIISYNILYEKADAEEKASIREKAIAAHNELEKISDKDDSISQQLLARSKVIIGKENGEYTKEEKLSLLTDALKITQPGFDISKIDSELFDYDEVKLINHIAIAYSDLGEHDEALNIWKQLLINLERRFDKIVPVRTQQTLILVGYSRELGITGKYAEAIEYAQQGVDICLKYGVYQNLPALLMILAECFYQVGYTEKSKELFTESFYLCKVVRDEVNKKIAADSLKEYFQIQIN